METLLTACPSDLIPADDRQLIIRDLLLDLHDKVSKDFFLMEVKLPLQVYLSIFGAVIYEKV